MQGDLAEETGCVLPGRWWGQGRSQDALTHAATPASLEEVSSAGQVASGLASFTQGFQPSVWAASCSTVYLHLLLICPSIGSWMWYLGVNY